MPTSIGTHALSAAPIPAAGLISTAWHPNVVGEGTASVTDGMVGASDDVENTSGAGAWTGVGDEGVEKNGAHPEDCRHCRNVACHAQPVGLGEPSDADDCAESGVEMSDSVDDAGDRPEGGGVVGG